jgi:zinc finger protein
MEQPVRRIMDKETADKIDALLAPLREALDMEEGDEDGEVGRDGPAVMHESDAHSDKPFKPFTLTLDDPSGNSFLAFKDSTNDPQWNLRAYNRTFEQNVTLGLVAPKEEGEEATTKIGSADEFYQRHRANVVEHDVPVPEEVFSFPASCSSCGHELETRMKQINIPYFEEVILMSSTCPTCGYKDNEVKSGGKIKPLGKKVTLKIEAGDEDALSRDILKSDTCGLAIPEIDLVLQPGTLGGRFTTVEGILNEIYDELSTKVFRTGDSGTAGHAQGAIGEAIVAGDRNFEQFLQGLKDVMAVKNDFTLILDDPLSNSYLQNTNAPDPDPDMTIEEYERTKEQNDDLGLSDMKVEGYNPDIKDKL